MSLSPIPPSKVKFLEIQEVGSKVAGIVIYEGDYGDWYFRVAPLFKDSHLEEGL